jgi:putative phage-type endonuclease
MKTHDLIQGSPEWLAYRAQHFNASDAPAMMGCSPYKTRAELLREMHTGVVADVDIATQKRFDNGHRVEALARPLAEEFIGEELYPVTGSAQMFDEQPSRALSASFDGLTLDERQGFEHKALNATLRAAFQAMAEQRVDQSEEGRLLPIYHRVQMEQQLMVSGAERILFMASQWADDGELIEEQHCWYYPDATLRQQIVDGWAQFERDLAAYVRPAVAAEAAPVGKTPDTLPALRIEVTGAVTASNLAEFKATALGAIRGVNRTLKTDQDFADAEKAVKWCSDIEAKLKAAKEHALSQTATIDALFKALDDIGAEAKAVRLDLDKLVTRRKTEVKEEAVAAARAALDKHIADLNGEIAPMRLRPIAADFAGCIKGMRSFASMQDKLDALLATTKIAADAEARAVRANVAVFQEKAAGFEFLFADLGQIVHKEANDFALLVASRLAAHVAAEAEKARKRAEEEAQRIAAAEQRAREQEAARIAEQQRQEQAAEAARIAAEATARAAAERAAAAPSAPAVAPAAPAPVAQAPATVKESLTPARADEPATLTLGVICERLGVTVRAEFLADTLHVKPAAMPIKGRGLYSESQFQRICTQLVAHISATAELCAEVTV